MPELILDHRQLLELSAEILSQGSSFRFQAGGGSMTPLIQPGDILTVQPVDAASLNVGQVIFYHAPKDRLVAHRIIRLEDGGPVGSRLITVRGDANRGPGENIRPHQVLGRVVSIERSARTIDLDTFYWRWLGYAWSKLAPAALRLRAGVDWAALGLMSRLSALRVYRRLVGNWFGARTAIRYAEIEDAHALSRLYGYHRNPALENPDLTFARRIEDAGQGDFILVAYIGDRLAGSLTVVRHADEETLYPGWWLFGMLVRLRYRGAGIGAKLLDQVLLECAERGASRINLLVEASNRAAINLYTKSGFRPHSYPELERELASEARRGFRRRIILSRPLDINQGD